jgi:hypothetical protein
VAGGLVKADGTVDRPTVQGGINLLQGRLAAAPVIQRSLQAGGDMRHGNGTARSRLTTINWPSRVALR